MDERRLLESIGEMIKTEMKGFEQRLTSEMASFKRETKADNERFRQKFRKELRTDNEKFRQGFRKEMWADNEKFHQEFRQEIQEELAEPKQILRALEYAAEISKADHDAIKIDIAHIKGDLEGLKKKVFTLEKVTTDHWKQ